MAASAPSVPVVNREGGVYAPTKQQVSEASIASLGQIFAAFDPNTKLGRPSLEKINDALLLHWYGRISADGRWAIQFNPIADLFLFLQIDPENSDIVSARWLTGRQALTLFSIPEKKDVPFLPLVFGERAMEMYYIIDQYQAGKYDISALLTKDSPEGADLVGAIFSYLNGGREMVLSPCFVEFEYYIAGRDWTKLGETLDFDPKLFEAGYKVIYRSKDGQYFVADAATGRNILVFKAAESKTCDFYPLTTVGII